MTKHIELIAQLREMSRLGHWPLIGYEAADAIEALASEREQLQRDFTYMKQQRDALQAQLAAAQGQEPAGYFVPESWDQLGKVTEWAQTIAKHGQPLYAAPIPQQPATALDLIDVLCSRIKAADDAMADNDYMLDSDDCIAVIRGTWKPPMLNAHPAAPHNQRT